MKLKYQDPGYPNAIQQLQMNGCRWIGNFHNDPADDIAGQTFQLSQSGNLETVSIYFEMIPRGGRVKLSLHHFDDSNHSWGPALGSAEMELNKDEDPGWVEFRMGTLQLDGTKRYGFRLHTQDALLALGEAVWGHSNINHAGEEWIVKGNEKNGHYYRYFSLVYSLGMN